MFDSRTGAEGFGSSSSRRLVRFTLCDNISISFEVCISDRRLGFFLPFLLGEVGCGNNGIGDCIGSCGGGLTFCWETSTGVNVGIGHELLDIVDPSLQKPSVYILIVYNMMSKIDSPRWGLTNIKVLPKVLRIHSSFLGSLTPLLPKVAPGTHACDLM